MNFLHATFVTVSLLFLCSPKSYAFLFQSQDSPELSCSQLTPVKISQLFDGAWLLQEMMINVDNVLVFPINVLQVLFLMADPHIQQVTCVKAVIKNADQMQAESYFFGEHKKSNITIDPFVDGRYKFKSKNSEFDVVVAQLDDKSHMTLVLCGPSAQVLGVTIFTRKASTNLNLPWAHVLHQLGSDATEPPNLWKMGDFCL